MKATEVFSSKIVKKIIGITAIALVVILAAVCIRFFVFNDTEKVTTEYILATLEKSSELTTSKLKYTGMTEYTDSGIDFINKSDFIMVYQATVRAGIDVKDVIADVDDSSKTIWLSIPKAEIQEVKVDTSSIKYFDEKFSLFNVDEKEDGNKAIALAEESAKEEAANMGILEMADQQSEALIKGMLEGAVPKDYTIKIK